jgi:uncharacterized protein YlxP (DUF503 family)
MRVAALRVEIHIPAARSLKEKRSILRPIIDGARRLGSYSIAEVDHHDHWQRATLGAAVVAPDRKSLEMQLGKLRRYLDSRLDIEVIQVLERELEEPE